MAYLKYTLLLVLISSCSMILQSFSSAAGPEENAQPANPVVLMKTSLGPIRIELWQKAFQSAPVASGDHLVTFEYSPASIRIGALVSLCSLAGLIVIARRNRVSKPHQAPAPPSNSPASTSST